MWMIIYQIDHIIGLQIFLIKFEKNTCNQMWLEV